MGQGDNHNALDVLRQCLVDFADKKKPLTRSEIVQQQQRSGAERIWLQRGQALDPAECTLSHVSTDGTGEVEYIRADLCREATDGFRIRAVQLCRDKAGQWQRNASGYNERDGMAISLTGKAAAARELAAELEKLP